MELLSHGWRLLTDIVRGEHVVLLLLRLTLIGAIGHLALQFMRRSSAAARHQVAVATLALMVATPWLGLLSNRVPAIRVPVPTAKAAVLDVASDDDPEMTVTWRALPFPTSQTPAAPSEFR